jgi:serine/threonine protein phosphatase 1
VTETAFIGDIHGCTGALEALLADAHQRTSRFVFLGDYVNRGPDSSGTIERLVRLGEEGAYCTFLAGNHDVAFRRALEGSFDEFLTVGGAATVRSYIDPPYRDVAEEFADAVPASHRRFLENLATELIIDELHVAHRAPPVAVGGRFVIAGHAPQRRLVPTVTEDAAYIDTGCGTVEGGVLTCFYWPSRIWVTYPTE